MIQKEKRKFPRLVLQIEDGYFGNFRLSNNETLTGPMMNLSAGGMNIAIPQAASGRIRSGDELLVKNIAGGTTLSFLSDLKAEIRWIKDLGHPGYVFVGCKFNGIPDEVLQQLHKFVDTERKTRGQYG